MFTHKEQIIDWLKQYLEGKLTWEEFMDTFVAQTWDIHQTENQGAIDLAERIDNLWIRYSEDLVTRKELTNKFKEIVYD